MKVSLINRVTKLPKSFATSLTPIQCLVMGYALVVLFIAFLLTLPISSANPGVTQSFVDAIFMASSGISTCGLCVVDVGSYYSHFGQVVLLVDVQIGGIGYMSIFIFIAYILNMKTSMLNKIIARESMSGPSFGGLLQFFKSVIAFTFIFEFIGAFILMLFWMREFPIGKAAYYGVYHSINAFCTAGVGLLPNNLMNYQKSYVMNFTIIAISLIGGIGFFVLNDIYFLFKKKVSIKDFFKSLTVHSKLAIITTATILFITTVIVFISENWSPDLSLWDRIMSSVFQTVSASTTNGHNTMNIGAMSATSLCAIMMLMFIGASPGSTGGGIKTTTFGVIWLSLIALWREKDVVLFKRRISAETSNKSFAIFFWFVVVITVDILVMAATEKGTFLQILFEIVSALGNTGLSTGITSSLSTIGKILLSIAMFVGRVGPLTVSFALLGKAKTMRYTYAEAEVFVG